jgi:hypothetical protein
VTPREYELAIYARIARDSERLSDRIVRMNHLAEQRLAKLKGARRVKHSWTGRRVTPSGVLWRWRLGRAA